MEELWTISEVLDAAMYTVFCVSVVTITAFICACKVLELVRSLLKKGVAT